MSKVHFILDEAAALGHLDAIDDAVGLGRGYGVRLQLYFQSLGQARRCFPDGQEQTLLSNTSQIYFAVNDQQTAELVSNRLGEQTIVVTSGGTSTGDSVSWSEGHCPTVSRGRTRNRNDNWQQQARKLLKPEEVTALPPRAAVTFTPGIAPIYTTLLRFYERDFNPGRLARARADLVILFHAAVAFVLAVGVAFALTITVSRATTPPASAGGPLPSGSDHVQGIGDGGSAVQRDQGGGPGRRAGDRR